MCNPGLCMPRAIVCNVFSASSSANVCQADLSDLSDMLTIQEAYLLRNERAEQYSSVLAAMNNCLLPQLDFIHN